MHIFLRLTFQVVTPDLNASARPAVWPRYRHQDGQSQRSQSPEHTHAYVPCKGLWLQEPAEHLAIELHGTICMYRLLC